MMVCYSTNWINNGKYNTIETMTQKIYLYLKTHNVTGLKYLGKTVQNPFVYEGSGKYWLNHINKHGNDVNTEILFESSNIEEIKNVGLYFSNLWNVVESKQYANLIPEYGTGGDTSMCFTEETLDKIRTSLAKTRETMDLSRSVETKQKISETLKGHKVSEETKKKQSEKAKLRGNNGNGFQSGHEPWNKGYNSIGDKIWVNNGKINKRLLVEDMPEGFVKGKLKK